jgi:hypothetical protein
MKVVDNLGQIYDPYQSRAKKDIRSYTTHHMPRPSLPPLPRKRKPKKQPYMRQISGVPAEFLGLKLKTSAYRRGHGRDWRRPILKTRHP